MAQSKLLLSTRESTERSLECSICLSAFSKPKLLACLHTFCLECLKKYCNDISDDMKPCPLCRREFVVPDGGVEMLKTDEVIARLVLDKEIGVQAEKQVSSNCDICETGVARAFCLECRQRLCDTCLQAHSKLSSTKLHRTVGLEENIVEETVSKLKTNFCRTHVGKEIELYCCDCKKLLCYFCHATEHVKHVCKVISDEAKSKCTEFAEVQNRIRRCIADEIKQKRNTNAESTSYLDQISMAEKFLEDSCSEIVNHIMEQKATLLATLGSMKTSKMKRVETENDLAEFRCTELNSFLAYSNMVMERGTDCEIIGAAEDLHKRAEELIWVQCERSQDNSQKSCSKFLGYVTSKFGQLKNSILKTKPNETLDLARRFIMPSNEDDSRTIKLNKPILGVTVVEDKLFVVQHGEPQVNVYDSRTLKPYSIIHIPSMKSYEGLTGCSHNKVIYIIDNQLQCIHRANIYNKAVKQLKIKYCYQNSLSLTDEHNLLVTLWNQASRFSRVLEYTSEGQLLREIHLDRSIEEAWQTIQLSSDQFIICHGGGSSALNKLCVINSAGQIIKSYGREGGCGEDQLCMPRSLALDKSREHVFVADCRNDRVLMFSADLALICQHQSRDLSLPSRLFYDSTTDQLIVGDVTGCLLVIGV